MSQMPPTSPSGGTLAAHRGAMILVFGILGIVFCFPFGIAAWVMGNSDLQAMAMGRMDPSGEGLVKAGKICGIISVAIVLLSVAIWVLFFVVFAGATIAGAA